MAGLFSSLFKKKEALPPFHLSSLKADMHSHLIPGIDDGAKNVQESLKLISEMEEGIGVLYILTSYGGRTQWINLISGSFHQNR